MIRTTLLGILLALLVAATAACPPRDRDPSERERSILGTSLPLEAPLLGADRRLDLAELRGQVVLVDFWASWCAPCREATPFHRELFMLNRERGLTIVAVSVDDERDLAERFIAEHAMPFFVLWDEAHRNAERWPIETMPTSFLVDREGLIRHVYRGFDRAIARRLQGDVEALLGSPTPRHGFLPPQRM